MTAYSRTIDYDAGSSRETYTRRQGDPGARRCPFSRSFTAMGRRLNGTIKEDDLVERVLTWVANPLFGDMIYDHRYTGYQDFGGVMFPTVMPAERILINADLYSPPAPGADPPAVTPNMRSLAKLPAARATSRRAVLGDCWPAAHGRYARARFWTASYATRSSRGRTHDHLRNRNPPRSPSSNSRSASAPDASRRSRGASARGRRHCIADARRQRVPRLPRGAHLPRGDRRLRTRRVLGRRHRDRDGVRRRQRLPRASVATRGPDDDA